MERTGILSVAACRYGNSGPTLLIVGPNSGPTPLGRGRQLARLVQLSDSMPLGSHCQHVGLAQMCHACATAPKPSSSQR